MKKLLAILPILALGIALPIYTLAQTQDPELYNDTQEVDPETTDNQTEEDVPVDESDEGEIINSDQTEPYETGLVDDTQAELINDEVEVEETTVEGEVVEITDEYLVVGTDEGEQVRVSRGGGSLLSPFVRQAALGNVQVGDDIEITVAESVTLEGEVQGVTESGTLVVTTEDGQRRTIQPGLNGVKVTKGDQVVTDFSTLSAGDEIEVVYEGELISAVDNETDPVGGWITPVIIILIVLGLAAVLARRGKRLE